MVFPSPFYDEAQEHHLVPAYLKCTPLSSRHLQFQAPKKHALHAHIDPLLGWHTSYHLECFFKGEKEINSSTVWLETSALI